MPEYLAPGVYVEEVSFRQKTIEGVSTSTTGFIGPTRFGPLAGEPELITSFTDFERIYGGIDQLEFEDQALAIDNHVAHAARAFFEEGGRRLYVARTFAFPVETDEDVFGRSVWPAATLSPDPGFRLRARFPGRAGDFTVSMTFRLGENVLRTEPVDPSDSSPGAPTHQILRGAQPLDTVWADVGSPAVGQLFWVERFFDQPSGRWTHRLRDDDPANDPPVGAVSIDDVSSVRVLTVGVVVSSMGKFGDEQAWEGLTFHPGHLQALSRVFDPQPQNPSAYLRVPLTFERLALTNGADIAAALMAQDNVLDGTPVIGHLTGTPTPSDALRTMRKRLEGGSDGDRPGPGESGGIPPVRKPPFREASHEAERPPRCHRYPAPSEPGAGALVQEQVPVPADPLRASLGERSGAPFRSRRERRRHNEPRGGGARHSRLHGVRRKASGG